jgi:hypothetical protein
LPVLVKEVDNHPVCFQGFSDACNCGLVDFFDFERFPNARDNFIELLGSLGLGFFLGGETHTS